MSALARRSDPNSSRLAAQQMNFSGMAAKQCDEVLALLKRFPGHTSLELSQKGDVDRMTLARRLPDLASKKLARKGADMRDDTITGRLSVVWYPV